MASTTKSASSRTGGLTECPICLDIYKTPKSLPCFHTFCLRCLEDYGKNKIGGEEMPCPLCRKVFRVPKGGFKQLKSNLFIEQQLDNLKKDTLYGPLKDPNRCDICNKARAFKYCVDCGNGHVILTCSHAHTKMKSSQLHRVITQTKKNSSSAYARARPSYCEKHPDKPLELYCNDCQQLICLKCSAMDHKTHFSSDIFDTSMMFSGQLKERFPRLDRSIELNKSELGRLNVEKEKFLQEISVTEKAITDKGELVKRVVDAQVSQSLRELTALKTRRLDEIAWI